MKIIRITALWCMSCLVMNERLNKLKKEFNLQFEDYDFDYDEIGQFNVGNTLPVMIILNNQKPRDAKTGRRIQP